MWDPRNILEAINRTYEWAIDVNVLMRTPLFWQDYAESFPELIELEKSFPEIQAECLNILNIRDNIPNLEEIGGKYTRGGVHSIEWKSYLLKLGDFIAENCERCPQTKKALLKVPQAKIAFFSILYPDQHIQPHVGYYKGFLRYHLGIKIPKGKALNTCWLRVSDDPQYRISQDKSLINQGQTYEWKEAEGIIFDDMLLHEAANETEEIRVVLFVDVCRPMPFFLGFIHEKLVDMILKSPFFNGVRSNGIVKLLKQEAIV
jgi:ornithine lipid ester-linked acyl 2-hydroxylase